MTERIGTYFTGIANFVLFVFLIFIINSGNSELNAQETEFTMFNSAPLLLNPSNTGNFDGDWRVAGIFRNQWAATTTPFRTASVSADANFYILNQKIGAGFYFLNDESGIGGLTFNKLYASLAYEMKIKENYFSLGLQGGYVFGSVNEWGTWNNATGNFDNPSGESNFTGKTSYFDFNAGLKWKRSIGIFEPNAGIAFYHLNKPNNSFFDGDDKEDIKMSFHADVKMKLSDEFYLLPAILYRGMSGATQTIVGTNAGYNFLGNKSLVKQIFIGAYLKNGILDDLDAISLLAGATVGRIDIGVSYDINLSNLSKASGKKMGAFEISFIYKSLSTVLNSYSIPCERY